MYESSVVVGIVFTEWAGSRCGCEIDPFASPNSLRDIGQARAVASRTQLPIGWHYATTGTLRQNRSC